MCFHSRVSMIDPNQEELMNKEKGWLLASRHRVVLVALGLIMLLDLSQAIDTVGIAAHAESEDAAEVA